MQSIKGTLSSIVDRMPGLRGFREIRASRSAWTEEGFVEPGDPRSSECAASSLGASIPVSYLLARFTRMHPWLAERNDRVLVSRT